MVRITAIIAGTRFIPLVRLVPAIRFLAFSEALKTKF